MLTIGGVPSGSVNPVNSHSIADTVNVVSSGCNLSINEKPHLGKFFRIPAFPVASVSGKKHISVVLGMQLPKLRLAGRFLSTDPKGYTDSMNMYQAFNNNPVNFTDPMGTVVNSMLIDSYGSIETAEHNTRVTYTRFRRGGDSHKTAYNKLLDFGFVTHEGTKEDALFELSLSLSPIYGEAIPRKVIKKRPTAETISDISAGFGDRVSENMFDLLVMIVTRGSQVKPKGKIVPTKIYREMLQNELGLGDIKDMVDYESPAYEMSGLAWDGTVITLGALDATYNSLSLLDDIDAALGMSNNEVTITMPYKRPTNATTKGQRLSVQGKPCHECGETFEIMYADHKTPLIIEYYKNGKINIRRMRDVDSVQPHCPKCSSRQGGRLSNYAKKKKKELGL